MQIEAVFSLYLLPLAFIIAVYHFLRRREETKALAIKEEAIQAGLHEPMSLHPVIDASLCVGCKACIGACPEGDIIGLINNKAQLIEPANCIGHGACKAACPRGAISLVFGTATRGVDLPTVGPDFQSNVPGLYIAGELGGMGLIRNAIEQGRQAMAQISARGQGQNGNVLDVVIVGAGPAGLSASLAALEAGLRFVTLEQDSLGGTVAHFPRGKLVMTAPAFLPLIGEMKFKEVGKEELIEFWQQAVVRTGLRINTQERVETITPVPPGFAITTTRGTYVARSVLLAIGRRGTPRRLGVPGEDLPKVVYRLIDPSEHRGKHVLVVGGGDSALEAAASLAEEPGTRVTLSYRSNAFARAKTKNRKRIERACATKQLEVMLSSTVTRIGKDRVELMYQGQPSIRRNDLVIVCAGGVMPTEFLKSAGIGIETKYGTA